jgi:hypothetical protein
LKFPQEVQPVGGFCLVAVNDEGDDEGVDDGDHEVLGGDEVVRQFSEKMKQKSFKREITFERPLCNSKLSNESKKC